MAKLSLTPAATFTMDVEIPVQGQGFVPVNFTFKVRGKKQMQKFHRDVFDAWQNGGEDADDVGLVLQLAEDWELNDKFTRENVAQFCDIYPMAAVSLVNAYFAEYHKFRAKN